MFTEMMMSAGGGGGGEMEICGYQYAPPYDFAILNTKTGEIKSLGIPNAGTPTELSGNLIKVTRIASHQFTYQALNGAYLYRIGSASGTNNVESFGQNGTCTSVSDIYQRSYTMIATKQPLNV